MADFARPESPGCGLWTRLVATPSHPVEVAGPRQTAALLAHLPAALGARGIAVRAGLHCAPWAHCRLGTLEGGGVVRVSVG